MKIKLIKEELEQKSKISHSLAELTRLVGYSAGSYHTEQRIKKHLLEFNIDFSHFDKTYARKQKRQFNIINTICPICQKGFQNTSNPKRKLIYCSHYCANQANVGRKNSSETREKISQALKGKKDLNRVLLTKICLFCKKQFIVTLSHKDRKSCSLSCSSRLNWANPIYRANKKQETIQKIANGKFGWKARQALSFPERLYKDFLEINGFKNKFINNFLVSRKDLDSNDGNYYLDFYFPDFKLDLEIDGQQHKNLEERIASDKIRDQLLINKNYIVHRIEWREVTTAKGKMFLEQQKQNLLQFLKNLMGQ